MKDKLYDILLFSKKYYKKLTDKKYTLYLGILMVGAIDLLLPDTAEVFKQIFAQKASSTVIIDAIILAAVIVLIGIVDVTFVTIPLYDIFNFIKGKESGVNVLQTQDDPDIYSMEPSAPSDASRIKVMKAYISVHFLITPVSMLFYYLFTRNITGESPAELVYLALAVEMLLFIWIAAILTRGINELFRFNPIFARITFLIVFTWYFIFNMAFSGQIMQWVWKLFI